jgi:hypothetical protein
MDHSNNDQEIDHRSDSEFSEFDIVEVLCYWRKGDRLAMIWCEHQDMELPVSVALAVLTRQQVRA